MKQHKKDMRLKKYNKNATPRAKHYDIDSYDRFGRPLYGKLSSPLKTHTSPVEYTPENDGHDNPTRLRHAATKARHAANRAAHE